MKKLILMVAIIAATGGLYAQPLAMKNFLKTQFIHELDSVRLRAEKSVQDFKAIQHMYTEEDIKLVRDKYDAAAGLFNNTLLSVKSDLLNKDKRKFIRKFPDDYSKIMLADLYRAQAFYEQEYMSTIQEVTDGRVSGLAFLATLITVYELGRKGWEMFKKVNQKWKGFNEQMLNTHLIQKHRFKLWDEL